jgi:two-component sensor histidine kinase
MDFVSFIRVLRKYQDTPAGYLMAAAVLLSALGVRELVDPYIKIPYVTLFPAMVICSLVGGRIAGILSAIIGGVIAWYFWLPPRGSLRLEWPVGHLTVALYVVTSTVLLLLMRGLNETMRALEKERDFSADLFRELQHRTANNLQSVSAMLQQNRRAIERDPASALDVIDQARRRFEIMSRINRRLYSPEMHEIKASSLFRDLCEDIRSISGSDQIECVVRDTPIRLNRQRAMLLSLLVAELMLNAIKHAFDDGQPGKVEIDMSEIGKNQRFTFIDNGRGFSPNEQSDGAEGLGRRIMEGLVRNLEGTMGVTSGPGGTRVEVLIPRA